MTSRRSSGSSRAHSAVEPMRSQNITLSGRRSAVVSDASGQPGLSVGWAKTGRDPQPAWLERDAAMATNSRRRWPTATTPRSCRSSAVRWADLFHRRHSRGMPPHTVPDRVPAATPRRPSPLPPIWRCVRRTITSGSHVCPGQEAQVASGDLRPTAEDKVWSKRQRPIFAAGIDHNDPLLMIRTDLFPCNEPKLRDFTRISLPRQKRRLAQ